MTASRTGAAAGNSLERGHGFGRESRGEMAFVQGLHELGLNCCQGGVITV